MQTILTIVLFCLFMSERTLATDILYGVQDQDRNNSQLFTFSPDTLKTEPLGDVHLAYDLEALEVDSQGILYATSGDDASQPGNLYTIDTQTGQLTKIGNTGFNSIESLAFSPDDTLWGWAKGQGLVKINPQTATTQLVFSTRIDVEGVTWDLEGSHLYAAQGTHLWVYDGATVSKICELPGPTESLEILPNGNLLMGIHNQENLLGLNPTTCEIFQLDIHTEYNDVEGLAWSETTSPATLSLDQGITSVTLEVKANRHVAFSINLLKKDDGTPSHVTFSQTIDPATGGLTLTNDYPSDGWLSTLPKTFIVNERLSALTPGTYTVTSTATLQETGASDSQSMIITVIAAGGNDDLFLISPGTEPEAINPNVPTQVLFTSLIAGADDLLPTTLTLEELAKDGTILATLGELRDDGAQGDLEAGDLIYSGTFTIQSAIEGEKFYRTTTIHKNQLVTSEASSLIVTRFPIGTLTSNPASLVKDPDSGAWLYSDELIISFPKDVSPDRIQEIIAAEGAAIVGSMPHLGIFQLRIPSDGTAQKVWAKIADLETYPEVEYVEPAWMDIYEETSEVEPQPLPTPVPTTSFPNDPQWVSQTNLSIVRADETWLIAKGTLPIAIIDTGIDYTHAELQGKVINGEDFIANDSDSMDPSGQGTQVAGLAAAKANNHLGIAGVAWGSKLLAVRGLGSSQLAAANAIRYATNLTKIINYSGHSYIDSMTMRKVVDYVVEKKRLLISPAGDDNRNQPSYPCAYEAVLCVGNSTNQDERSATSNYGPWIDLAAPGDSVTATTLNNQYVTVSGSRYSAPLVSGAAAIIWSTHKSWTATQVRERLLSSAQPLAYQIGPRLDLFEAIFNGSFELDDLAEWTTEGTCNSFENLGSLLPPRGQHLGFCSTGPAKDNIKTALTKTLNVQPGVATLPIQFDYNFVTEEYPEWVGTPYNDVLKIILTSPDGTETILAHETVNDSIFFPITGIDFPGGDSTVGHTGWKTVTHHIPITSGSGVYKIEITDAGDDVFDSVVLIDNIRLK